MYIQASIGRNVAMVEALTNEPTGTVEAMGDTVWATFQNDVKDEIFLAVHDVDIPAAIDIEFEDFQVHTGIGEWQGVAEESAHVSLYFEGPHTNSLKADGIRDNLTKRLSYLAFQYGQDAIAFVVTDSHLANAR